MEVMSKHSYRKYEALQNFRNNSVNVSLYPGPTMCSNENRLSSPCEAEFLQNGITQVQRFSLA